MKVSSSQLLYNSIIVGVPEFTIEELLHQCEADCFKKLLQVDIEGARKRFYELGSETAKSVGPSLYAAA